MVSFVQQMSRPLTSSMEDLKRVGRHLLRRPSVTLRYEHQRLPSNICVSVDSDCCSRSCNAQISKWYGSVAWATSDQDNFELANISWSQRERRRVLCFVTWSAPHGLRRQAFMRDFGSSFSDCTPTHTHTDTHTDTHRHAQTPQIHTHTHPVVCPGLCLGVVCVCLCLCVCVCVCSFIHSFVRSFVSAFVRSFVRLFVCLFVYVNHIFFFQRRYRPTSFQVA